MLYGGLSITPVQTKYEVEYKKTSTIECTVEHWGCQCVGSITWERRGKSKEAKTEQIHRKCSKFTKFCSISNQSLDIKLADENDSGFYSCEIQLEYENPSHQTIVARSDDIELCVYGLIVDKHEYDINSGNTAVLKCRWIDRPISFNVYWKTSLNEQLSIPYQRRIRCLPTAQNTSLVISSCDVTHGGLYSCYADYTIGECSNKHVVSDRMHLNVCAIRMPSVEYTVDYGTSVTLECVIIGSPKSKSICWQKKSPGNTLVYINIDGSKYKGSTVINPSLVISNVNENDTGSYFCTATIDGNDDLRGKKISVNVEALRMTSLEYTVNKGSSIMLECVLAGTSNPSSVFWQKRKFLHRTTNNVIIDDSKYIGSTVKNPSLVIVNVNQTDSGYYFCNATIAGKRKPIKGVEVFVTVEGILSIMVTKTSYDVPINGSVNLKCSISGHPPPQFIYWVKVKDGTEKPVTKHMIVYDYSPAEQNDIFLPIGDADDSHDGVYKCIAVNYDSQIESLEINLSVLGGYRTILETFKLSESLVLKYKSSKLKYMPNADNLKKRQKCYLIKDIQSLKAGMLVCYTRKSYNHLGIVTNVMPTKNTYEVIHMTGDKDTVMDKHVFGIAEIRKEQKSFEDGDISYYYDYGEYSIDNICSDIQKVHNQNSEGSIVSKRACILYEAFDIFRYDVFYRLFSFNCEHFASYCATGLAFCKQKDLVTLTSNLRATALLDKMLTVYCEEKLETKRPSDATFKTLQKSCLLENREDVQYSIPSTLYGVQYTSTRSINSIQELKEGTEVIVKIHSRKHHAVVTDVYLGKNMFEVIHLTGVDGEKGEIDCQKLLMKFKLGQYSMFDYGDLSIQSTMNIDGNIIKLRACILHKIFHTIKDLRYHPSNFNCDNFASYCVVGLAYNKETWELNGQATKTLDAKLIEYCSKFISLPE